MMKKLLLGLLLCSVGFGVVASQLEIEKELICKGSPAKDQCVKSLSSMLSEAAKAGVVKGACDISIIYEDTLSDEEKENCERARERVEELTSK